VENEQYIPKIAPEFSEEIFIGHLDKSIVFLAGKAGSGKGTASTVMNDYFNANDIKSEEIALADVMREIARMLGWTGEKTPLFRKFMQGLGTDIVRNIIGEDVWINIWFKLARRSEAQIVIINDFRFVNEIEVIRDHCNDYLSVKVLGKEDGYTDYQHKSEAGVEDDFFHAIIENNYTDSFEDRIMIEAALFAETLECEPYEQG